MALSVEQINTKVAGYTIVGWFVGLAYYNWFSSNAIHVSFLGHVILVVVGMFASSIIIGAGIALLLGFFSKPFTGRMDGSPSLIAWGGFISPVIAFFAAGPAIRIVSKFA